jgi:uncharacterized protein with PIN domain
MKETTTLKPNNNLCSKCGHKFWNDNKSTAIVEICNCKKTSSHKCWECFKCGRVNAIWVATCPCYKKGIRRM